MSKLPCPCCGFLTLAELDAYEICPVCYWEDDGQADNDADKVRGGPNYELSLTMARSNYANFGACSQKWIENVRPPHKGEIP